MTNTQNIVTGSTTNFSQLQLSGTQFAHNRTLSLTLLCALSGLSIIPIKCDNAGRIGSIA